MYLCKKLNDMKDIAIYTLTSELHDAEAVGNMTNDFLASLQTEYDLKGDNFADYGMHTLNLIFVRTGGTEGIFKRLLPQLQALSGKPVYLLTSGKSNSLAASMEILSYLRQNNLKGEIIHGSADYIQRRINLLANAGRALKQMDGSRLGIVGKPSDWLISSSFDRDKVRERLGILLEDIDMQELLDVVSSIPVNDKTEEAVPSETIGKALPGALRIYEGLKQIVGRHQLQGFTIRCFDLLTALRNTGCIALAKLNAEGIVSGCEGDVPAMISMKIAQALTGLSGFQANPASINPETGEITFAHCTIPLNMVERYELDTHFESGIGVGIRGFMKEGPLTIFKVSGDLSRSFVAEGELVRNMAKPDLCRTQQVIQLDEPEKAAYFLTNPIGNHHIILPGRWREALEEIVK